MLEFQERKKIRRILYSKWVFAALVIALVVLARAALGVYGKYNDSKENLRVASDDLNSLESRQSTLQSEIGKLSTERGMEEEIRDTFQVAKDGEQVAIIVEPTSSKPSAAPAQAEP
jgi:cell division protein FtsB